MAVSSYTTRKLVRIVGGCAVLGSCCVKSVNSGRALPRRVGEIAVDRPARSSRTARSVGRSGQFAARSAERQYGEGCSERLLMR
jgi:hypothetical protein